MDMLQIPDFSTKKELFDFLVENKSTLIAQKKYHTKHSDAFISASLHVNEKGEAVKANSPVQDPPDNIKVRAIINTTNLLDSHGDVHLPGLWEKSLKENKDIMHIQEHEMRFKNLIAKGSDLEAYAKYFTWKKLGFDWPGKTQALVFDSSVSKSVNEFMWGQYAKGHVTNHSVGMQYVRLILAVNNEDYGAEFEAWEKYYPEIINNDAADNQGYFWAVKEAKVIEGSAVLRGSNFVTPTLDNNIKTEPLDDTRQTGPLKSTRDSKAIIEHFKNLNT